MGLKDLRGRKTSLACPDGPSAITGSLEVEEGGTEGSQKPEAEKNGQRNAMAQVPHRPLQRHLQLRCRNFQDDPVCGGVGERGLLPTSCLQSPHICPPQQKNNKKQSTGSLTSALQK